MLGKLGRVGPGAVCLREVNKGRDFSMQCGLHSEDQLAPVLPEKWWKCKFLGPTQNPLSLKFCWGRQSLMF